MDLLETTDLLADHPLPDAPAASRPGRPSRPAAIRAVIAVPVRDEAERIAACLAALSRQTGVRPGTWGVVLLLNNCTDDTAAIVAALRPSLRMAVRVLVRDDPRATAGWARRAAMDAAAAWLGEAGRPDGILLTTDADSRVAPGWLARNLLAIETGADVVAGRIALDPDEAALLPDALHARGALEAEYEGLLAEFESRWAPDPADPWPRHRTDSGASLAVRLAAYAALGGLPPIPLGEDRAFVSLARGSGFRVRHDPDILVVTSGRLQGRAAGGAADTMRLRAEDADAPCDEGLLPFWSFAASAVLKPLRPADRMAPASAPLLPRDLPREIARARRAVAALRWLARLRRASPVRRAGRPYGPPASETV